MAPWRKDYMDIPYHNPNSDNLVAAMSIQAPRVYLPICSGSEDMRMTTETTEDEVCNFFCCVVSVCLHIFYACADKNTSNAASCVAPAFNGSKNQARCCRNSAGTRLEHVCLEPTLAPWRRLVPCVLYSCMSPLPAPAHAQQPWVLHLEAAVSSCSEFSLENEVFKPFFCGQTVGKYVTFIAATAATRISLWPLLDH